MTLSDPWPVNAPVTLTSANSYRARTAVCCKEDQDARH